MHPGCQAKTVKKEHCPDGKIRSENDIVCHACPLGKIPNSAKNGCLPCPNGMVSDGFNCSPCLIDNKSNIGWFEQPHYNLKTLKNLVLKITGTQGVSRSQKIASKELLRVVDDQTPFGPDDIDEQVKTLILDTGVQPDCIVFLKCPAGTKIKEGCVAGEIACGTGRQGYIRVGTHPTRLNQRVKMTVCFKGGSVCPPSSCAHEVEIEAINCGSYYVYDLPNIDDCAYAYCTE